MELNSDGTTGILLAMTKQQEEKKGCGSKDSHVGCADWHEPECCCAACGIKYGMHDVEVCRKSFRQTLYEK